MEFEPMNEFDEELKLAMERHPAPPGLKGRVMQERARRAAQRRRHHSMVWMRLAASLVIVALLGGAADWGIHKADERRKGEEARRQVMMALRITGRELNQVHARLAAHDHFEERYR